jgi:hypothetical protein
MPLSPAAARDHIHTRVVECKGYRRADGLWDIEGHITDRKTYSYTSDERGEVKAGEPVHDMWLRLTLNNKLTVVAVEAVTDHAPYPAICPGIAPDYQKIVGLSVGPGWTRAIKERVGGVQGCTHLTELLGPVATTAFQTIYPLLAREAKAKAAAAGQETRGPQPYPLLNTCHSFRADGPVVAKYAPHLYTGPQPEPEKADK